MLTGSLVNRVPAHDDRTVPTFAGRDPGAVGAAGSTTEQYLSAGASAPFTWHAVAWADFRRSIRWSDGHENAVLAQIRARHAEIAASAFARSWRGRLASARRWVIDTAWLAWMLFGAVCLAVWLCLEYGPDLTRERKRSVRSSPQRPEEAAQRAQSRKGFWFSWIGGAR
jgi:hypothetical protein